MAQESVVITLVTTFCFVFLLFGALVVLGIIKAEKTSQVYGKKESLSTMTKLVDFIIDKVWVAIWVLIVTIIFLLRSVP